MYDPNDELMQRLAGRNRQGLFSRVKENVLNPSGDNVYKAAMILSGQKPQDDSNEKLATQIALLNYKQGLKPEETPDGYASEADVPKTMGGLPLKTMKVGKGGRIMPEYSAEKPDPVSAIPSITTPDGKQEFLTGDAFLGSLPQQEQNLVKGLADYSLSPEKTFGLRNDLRAKYLSYAKQFDPTFDASQFNTRQKYKQELASTKGSGVGRSVVSLNTAIPHLQSLSDSMSKLSSVGGFPLSDKWNAVANWLKRTSGEAAPADVDTALNAVAGELSTVFKGTAGTDQEVESWKHTFNPNGSEEQKAAFIQRGIDLLQGRLGALEGQYSQTMGKDAPEGTFVYPKTKDVFDNLRTRQPFTRVGNKQAPPPNAAYHSESTGKYYDANGNEL